MDIIPILISQAGKEPFVMGTHLEWYTYIEYSAMTTQLSWVANQAVPAWYHFTAITRTKNESFCFPWPSAIAIWAAPISGILF